MRNCRELVRISRQTPRMQKDAKALIGDRVAADRKRLRPFCWHPAGLQPHRARFCAMQFPPPSFFACPRFVRVPLSVVPVTGGRFTYDGVSECGKLGVTPQTHIHDDHACHAMCEGFHR
jgi:hypothetical protein